MCQALGQALGIKAIMRHNTFPSLSQSGGRDTQIVVNILCYINKKSTEGHRAEEWRKTSVRNGHPNSGKREKHCLPGRKLKCRAMGEKEK